MNCKQIAIIGATSHIAKNLISGLGAGFRLSLFARSPDKITMFTRERLVKSVVSQIGTIDDFCTDKNIEYDAVINCVGLGTPDKLRSQGAEVLFVTERYDNIILDYVSHFPSAIYLNFSSGAVYGTDLEEPANAECEFNIKLSSISVADAYRVAKLNAETKHRSLTELSIIDLRIFNFFSRYMDMSSTYLMAGIVRAIKGDFEFVTSKAEIVRDFIHPDDLCALVGRCVHSAGINQAIDAYSGGFTTKSEILSSFSERFGLRVKYDDAVTTVSPTGTKGFYVSSNRDAERLLGYYPLRNSLQSLFDETQAVLTERL